MGNKFNVKNILMMLCLIILIVMIVYFKKVTGFSIMSLDINLFENILNENRNISILIYMILNILRPIFVIIPVWIFSVVSGVIYGPLLGSIYALIGIYISATIAFYLSRFLGRNFFLSLFGDKLHRINNKLEKNGFKVLFIMRLTVVFPFDPLSYIAGLSKMNYKSYIAATILGSIPETIAFNVVGVGLKSILTLKMIIILSVVALILVILLYLKGKIV